MARKHLIALALLCLPVIAYAKLFLVYQFTPKVRIVLTNEECLVKSLKGSRAAIQRDDGAFMKGCWTLDAANKNMVRIDWDNPKVPGDFAVIEFNHFKAVDNKE